MHVRMGPNQVGPAGLAQTFADVFKLLLKEVIYPTNASKLLSCSRRCSRWCPRSRRGR